MPAFSQPFLLTTFQPPPVTFNSNPGVTNIAAGLFQNGATALQFSPPAGTPANTSVTYQVEYKRSCDVPWTAMAPIQSSASTVNVTVPTPLNTAVFVRISANGGRFSPVAGFDTFSTTSESPDGTAITLPIESSNTNFIQGMDGTRYSLSINSTSPYVVTQGGQPDNTLADVIRLVYSGRNVYQQTKSYAWFSKTMVSDPWRQVASPILGDQGSGNPVAQFSVRNNPTGTVMSPNGGGDSLSNCQVTYVFVGDEWNTISNPSANDIINSMTQCYSGPYFSGLQEYGVFGKPTIVSALLLGGTPPDFSTGVSTTTFLNTTITSLFNNAVVPIPTVDNHLIMLITAPAAKNPPGVGGFHDTVSYKDLQYGAGMVFYIGSGGTFTLGQFTAGLTHETAEHITDARHIPQNWFGPGDGSNISNINLEEIADFSNQTSLVVNGVNVLGFYSNRQHGVIIPTADTPF